MKRNPLRNLILAGSALLAISSVQAQSGSWNVDAAGTWSTAGNWNPAAVPGTAAGDTVNLTNNISNNRIVTIDTTSRTVGTLNIGDFDDSHSFTLAASGGAGLTFNNSGSTALLTKTGAKGATISSGITLADNLEISIASGSITLSGNITGAKSITKIGAGAVTLSGANDYSGGFNLNGGSVSVSTGNYVGFGSGLVSIGASTVGITLTANSGSTTFTTIANNFKMNTGSELFISRNAGMTPSLDFTGDWDIAGNSTYRAGNSTTAANTTFSGKLSGSGQLTLTTAGKGSNTTLAGDNGAHTGGIVWNGTATSTATKEVLSINHAKALGTGAFTISGKGHLDNTSGSAITLTTNNTQNWNTNFNFVGTNDLNMGTGAVTMDNNRIVTVEAGTFTVGGAIGQTGGSRTFTKSGDGILVLGGTSSYTGATTVTAGTLLVNGSIATSSLTTVQTSATIGGSGTVGALTISTGGFLAAGNSIESLATGNLTLEAAATFAYEMNNDAAAGQAGDLTAVTGTLTLDLGNTSILTLSELGAGSWTAGDKLTLIAYSGAWNNGLFSYNSSTLADDSTISFNGMDWTFNYNDTLAGANYTSDLTGMTSFVTMTAIPEPKAVLLGSIGLLLLLRRRR